MSIRKLIKNFRNWCPQPPTSLPTKLKRYSMPIAAVITATLIFSVSFSVFSSSIMSHPSAPIVPVANGPSSSSTPSISPALQWNNTYAGIYSVSVPSQIIQTNDGGYLITGTSGHKYILSAAWLVKTNAQGDVQWNETLETIDGDLTYYLGGVAGIAQTSAGGYVIAGNEMWFNTTGTNVFSYPVGSDTILFKLDSAGNPPSGTV